MVGFEVMHDEVVGLTVAKGGSEVVEPLRERAAVAGIHDGNLLVENDVRVVAHPVGRDILAFEEAHLSVIDAYIFDVRSNGHEE